MFGRGAFTISRQEENNFLFVSERSFSSEKPQWFSGYFTSKWVKKPAEGPRGFKKNVSERNFGAWKYFNCYLQKQLCV